uniref:BTB/POZ domain-containing protein 8 n=1 Tax=Aceria tosichella TaxID=561515 RepID=A0A6G1S7N6_9ACAR
MAHVPRQPEQTQEHQNPRPHIRAPQLTSTTAVSQSFRDQQHNSQTTKEHTKNRTESVKSNDKNAFNRYSSQRHSKTLVSYPLETQKEPAKLQLAGIPKPSKHFARKCQAEYQVLLETIKPEYLDNIKSLYEDQIYVDLYIKIGDVDLERPLHKCIIASRAFKFYCALKGFKEPNSITDKGTIVEGLQASSPERHSSSISTSSKTDEKVTIPDQEDQLLLAAQAERKEEQLREALEVLNCELPENLINIEFLLSFARRAYLDQDLTEDETHLHLLIINWLKTNKPEVIKVANANKCSPDHRESFRTIQPDFEQLSISDNNSPAMSVNEQSSTELQKNANDLTGGENSREGTTRDDSSAVVGLTRTETFEMLSRTNPDDTSATNKDDDPTFDDEDKDRSEISVNTSESSEPYTPVTRTGLKPKKFTPIVGMKSSKSSRTTSVKKKLDFDDGDKRDHTKTTQSTSSNTSSSILTTTPPVVSKRSSLTVGISSNSESSTSPSLSSPAQASLKSRNSVATKTSPPKVRQTIVARAHPISLERSQSPATSLSKGPTKNFIAANKKLISQIEKKALSSTTHQNEHQAQANDDSENEISDASLLTLFEPLSTDNMAAQLDKLALVSHSKLADALSQLFIGGILTDMAVVARDNKEINAHRCILAARSAYLNDQLTKLNLPSMTSEGSTKQLIKIDLTEYSYAAVYFSMMHIYSGIVKVPEDLELEELTKLSHLLHVGTLRQVCMHNLRMNYCHFFHKPCNVCCIGVLKTLPLAWRYDLTELYTKCLQWIGANFAQIFCLEEFSNLKPRDLIEECYKETSSQLTPDNVIQKTIECQKLLKSLPRVKWTESIICLVGRQLEDFCHYVADNYEKIIQSESFLNLGKSCWECEVLEENLLAAMNHLKPDSGCKTLIQLDKIECSIETYCDEPRSVSETFANLISKMRKYCERYLLKEAAAVVHCSSWRMMSPSLQKKIKDQALIVTDFDEPTRHLSSKPKLPSMSRHQQQSSSKSSPSPQPNNSNSDTKSPSNRSTPDSKLKSPNTTYLPPPKTKPAAARHVKVLK